MSRLSPLALAILLSLALAACGGGGGGNDQPILTPEPAMATAGFDWFNSNRVLMGLDPVARSPQIDIAAQGHSKYQALNNVISHDQTSGNTGFTGADLEARFAQAGYNLVPSYATGEVIARTGYTDGFTAAEALITAIYHRFVIFEPMFKEAGAGATSVTNGYTYFTANFAATDGFGTGLTPGKLAIYPYDTQQQVPTSFDHGTEKPDPLPEDQYPQYKNVIVGYPISVHANITSTIGVTTFTVSQSVTGQDVPVHQLNSSTDPGTSDEPRTPPSAAAIIPLSPLLSTTGYTVHFEGSVDGQPVNVTWSFTTK